MIKKHQKLIALSVVFAFLCLLQASTMPLRAEQSSGQSETTMKSAEQGPSFVEQEGAPYAAKKKSIVPIVLIGVGVVAVAAVLIFVVFKTKYDIRGTWTVTYAWSGSASSPYTIIFTGSMTSGTFLMSEYSSTYPGTYTVNKKNASWTFTNYPTTYTGTFSDKNTMSGTMVAGSDNGTWSATKTSTASFSAPASVNGLDCAGKVRK